MPRMPRKKNSKSFKVNGDKLRAIIKSEGLVAKRISEEVGYNGCYISQLRNGSYIPKHVKCYLDLCGIPYESYKYVAPVIVERAKPLVEEPVEESEDETKEEPQVEVAFDDRLVSTLTTKQFSDLIYKAVYGAMIHAWKEV